MMGKNEEMKQSVIVTIKEWINEYAYVENICRLYSYYDRQRDISNEPNIIGLTCCSVYENLIVSLAKFFNVKKSKETLEVSVECKVLKKCINNANTFKISKDGKEKLNSYNDLWNSDDYIEFITNIKTRRDKKYAHKDKNKNEIVRNYTLWIVIKNLRCMLNDISQIFDVGDVIDEKSVIAGLESENEFLNTK